MTRALVLGVVALAVAATSCAPRAGEATPATAKGPAWSATPDAPFRAGPPTPAAGAPFVPAHVRSFSLSNGVRVFAYPRPGDVSAIWVLIDAPPGRELSERRTVLPLVASSMIAATPRVSDSQTRQRELQLGAEVAAFPWDNRVTIRARFRSESLADVVEVIGGIVGEPAFVQGEIDYRKSLREDWLAGRPERPDELSSEVLNELSFGPEHIEGAALGERIDDVRATTREQIVAAYAALRDPRRIIVAVAGSYDDSALQGRLERTFGSIPASAASGAASSAKVEQETPRSPRRVVLVDRPGAATTRLRLGGAGPRLAGTEEYAALLLRNILGTRGFGRLAPLQTKLSMTDSFGAVFRNALPGSSFSVFAEVPRDRALEALRDLEDAVDSLRRDGPTPSELEGAKRRLCDQQGGSFERAADIAWAIAIVSDMGQDPDARLREYASRVQAVTTSDVRAVAAHLLARESLQIVVLGDLARIREPLARGGYGADQVRDASGIVVTNR